jgi:Holliday junction DNA helicase RuvA
MIASIQGKIVTTRPRCIVAVGGIGLELNVPERDLDFLDDGMTDVGFHTYLYVREDRLSLYGFLRRDDRELFLKLLDVSGIGPKVALALLSTHPAGKIVAAVKREDVAALVTVPGLGKKTAERLIMELKDKLDTFAIPEIEPEHPASVREEVIRALTALGMGKSAAERALENIDWGALDEPSVETVVREALKYTGGL